MTELLSVTPDSRVLEIGTGSGFQTALLACLARQVYTVEMVPQLHLEARERLTSLGYTNILFREGDGSEGWPEESPFDRIIVTAAASHIPDELLVQLAWGGRMVIPVGPKGLQELTLVQKDECGAISRQTKGAVSFVEMKGRYGWSQHRNSDEEGELGCG
jgi:protein-L-isoaspartate(D-aspartate) O-methyltransferase